MIAILAASFFIALELNPNEVSSVRWLSQEQCAAFVDESAAHGELISPWFGAIARELLAPWWSALRRGEELAPDGLVHRLEGSQEAMSSV